MLPSRYLLLFCIFFKVSSHRVLVVTPFPMKSHYLIGQSVVRYLLEAGHEVTYITGLPTEAKVTNLTQIVYNNNMQNEFMSYRANISSVAEESSELDPVFRSLDASIESAAKVLNNDGVQKLLKDPNVAFDAVISIHLANELISGIAALFRCPMIWLVLNVPNKLTLNLISHTYANKQSLVNPYLKKLFLPGTMWEKFCVIKLGFDVLYKLHSRKNKEENLYEDIYRPIALARGIDFPKYRDIAANTSMVLFVTHPLLGYNIPLPPNARYIGGIHIQDPSKPLPSDLMNLLDANDEGTIYFSLGSNVDSTTLPEAVVSEIMNLFSELKQTVFWKFNGKLKDVPKNVIIRQWFPQTEILAHNNIRVFITHGGQSSMNEAVHYGVPIIGLPLFLDQFFNIGMSVIKGYGIQVTLARNLADQLRVALKKILNNDTYADKAEELSEIYNDRVLYPREELVRCVEFAIRTKGASQLRSENMSLGLHELFGLDIMAALMVTLFLLYCTLKVSFRFIKRKSKGGNNNNSRKIN